MFWRTVNGTPVGLGVSLTVDCLPPPQPRSPRSMIERKSGFLVFYTVATTLALLCLAFHVLNIPPTNAFFLSVCECTTESLPAPGGGVEN